MTSNSPPQDTAMANIPTPPPQTTSPSLSEPKYGGYTRFEIELEFVQSLANPWYINYLATNNYFEQPAFITYLDYLQYFTTTEYRKYLMWPGPTLRNLELVQQERFRSEIVRVEVLVKMLEEEWKAVVEWPGM